MVIVHPLDMAQVGFKQVLKEWSTWPSGNINAIF
jgi:hypothetical protein